MSDNVIPNELYYLGQDFSPRSLRRYQLKSILKSYNINVPSSSKKADMVKLFQNHVESRRETILAEYKAEQEAVDVSDKLGRGHRKTTPVQRYQSEEEEEPLDSSLDSQDDDNAQQKQENKLSERDDAGFAIPQVPESWYRRHKISKESPTPDEESSQRLQQHQGSESKERHPEAQKREEKQIQITPSFTAQDSFASSDDDASLPQKLQELNDRRRSSTRKKKHVSPKFIAQDSFASSDDDVFLPPKVEEMRERRTTKSRPYPIHLARQSEEPHASSNNSNSSSLESMSPDSKAHHAKRQQESEETKADIDSPSDESYVTDSCDNDASDEEEELDIELAPSNISGDEVKWLVEDIAKRGSTWESTFRIVGMTYKVLLVLTIVTTVFVLGSRHHNGYCSSELVQPEEEYGESGFMSSFVKLPGLCIPCPDHGTCVDGELRCPTFFSQQHRWYNINGILPFADECVRDSAMGRAIARAEKKIKRELARQQGNAVCKHLVETGSTKNSPLAKTRGADLYTELLAKDYAYVEDTGKLQTIISEALKSIMDDPKLHYWDLDGIPYYGTDVVRLPLWCSLYGMYTTVPVQTRWTIVAVLMSALVALYGRYSYTLRKSIQNKTQQHVAMILSELQEQLNRHIQDPDNQDRGYVVSQLRTKLAGANAPESLADWMRVTQAVKQEPQIRRGYREIGGEVCEYWELAA